MLKLGPDEHDQDNFKVDKIAWHILSLFVS